MAATLPTKQAMMAPTMTQHLPTEKRIEERRTDAASIQFFGRTGRHAG
jgi:hypothetical protein